MQGDCSWREKRNSVLVINWRTGKRVASIHEPRSEISDLAFNSTGRRLAVAFQHLHEIGYYELLTATKLIGSDVHATGIQCAVFSRDSKMLATVGMDQNLYFWSIKDAKQLKRQTWQELCFSSVADLSNTGAENAGRSKDQVARTPRVVQLLEEAKKAQAES